MKLPKYFIGTVEVIYGSKNMIMEVSNFDNDEEITIFYDQKYCGKYNRYNDIYLIEYIKNDNVWIKLHNKVGLHIQNIIEEY